MPRRVKLALIAYAARLGFRVVSEVGKKNPEDDVRLIPTAGGPGASGTRAGAWKVIVEGRESGTVGIYDARGAVLGELADALVAAVGVTSLVFEAPQKSQQVWLIQRYGAEVNSAISSRGSTRWPHCVAGCAQTPPGQHSRQCSRKWTGPWQLGAV